MWFADISKELISLMAKVRPQIEAYYRIEKRTLLEPKYSDPHFVYVIELDKTDQLTRSSSKPLSLRILESDSNGPIAFHSFSVDKSKSKLLQSMTNVKKINEFYKALDKIKGRFKDETNGEIRYLRIPSLNVQAVWIHFNDSTKDVFSLLKRFDGKELELFEENKFHQYIQPLKARVKKSIDNSGGLEGEKPGG